MAKIDSFRAQLVGGGARSNQFRVRLAIPGTLGGVSQVNALRKVEFMVKGAQLPASVIPTIPVAYRGRITNVAGDREFAPWTVNVYNDTDFAIRNALETWMANIANHRSTNGLVNSSLYQASMFVDQLDRNDNILKTYQFVNAFPTEISPIDLAFEQQGQIQEFQVTFTLDYWVAADTSDVVEAPQ